MMKHDDQISEAAKDYCSKWAIKGYLGEMFYNVFIYQQIFDGIQMKIDYIGEI